MSRSVTEITGIDVPETIAEATSEIRERQRPAAGQVSRAC